MIVAMASGKGGTGKTTVTASLASAWPRPARLVDLDVEEPNLHLFLETDFLDSEEVELEVPAADEELCNYCRACAEICQFKAINVLAEHLLLFTDMCHGCGGCLAVCPTGALKPSGRVLGQVSWGRIKANGNQELLMGRLRVGEALSPPLIKRVKSRIKRDIDALVDAPPGASCPAVNAVAGADVIVMVTEPTPFGLHDLKLAVAAFRTAEQPLGVVINRAGIGDDRVERFCAEKGLPVLASLPYDRAVATNYALGRIPALVSDEWATRFEDLAAAIIRLAEPAGQPEKEAAHG